MPLYSLEDRHRETLTSDAAAKTYTRYLLARTADDDTADDILAAAPTLRRNAPHPDNRQARVTKPTLERIAAGLWEITLEYSTAADDRTNPLARPTAWDLTQFTARTHYRSRDEKGRPIVNTAGGLFDDPPPSVERHYPTLRGTRNIPPAFPPWLLDYVDAVNSDAVRIRGLVFPPKTLKARIGIGPEETENDVAFSALSMEFEYNPATWRHFQPNRGYEELTYDKGQNLKKFRKPAGRRKILVDGEPITEPAWLDEYGRAIEDPAENLEKLIFLEFQLYPEKPFGALPL
jgi:hypothetical protein